MDTSIVFKIDCLRELKHIRISTYPEIYRHMRRASRFVYNPSFVPQSWGNQIEILNTCYFSCPVCYAEANDATENTMQPDAIISLVMKLKEQG